MHILLARPDGIGDQVNCLPVATTLRQMIPGVRISFLSSDYAAPVLEHHPDIDDIIIGSHQDPIGELRALFQRGFDGVVFLKPFRRLMLAAFLARVPFRVATGYRWYSFLANKRVYEHRHDYAKHEIEYNVGLLGGLGITPPKPQYPHLELTQSEQSWGRQTAPRAPRRGGS